ncbi:MAG TPA: hypothetical protein VFO35_11350 [Steroidobacteraceae bacterium]|nr:hypothetical protein [Steroidobacteraceae bacterium]
MRSSEPALRAVRTQVQFELAEAAALVAAAAAQTAEAFEQVSTFKRHCAEAAEQLRSALARNAINPPLLAAMRRVHRRDAQALQEFQSSLAAAQEREQQARAALADVRNRERSLDRALHAELRKQQLEQQAREMLDVDDLWLQHARRELP